MNSIYCLFSKNAQSVVCISSVCAMMAVLSLASAGLQAQGVVDLGVLPGGTRSAAYAINNDGVIVGTANVVGTGWDAVEWQNGQIGSIYSSAVGVNSAVDVNSSGDAAGTASAGVPNVNGYIGAARWLGGSLEFLPADPCGYLSDAYGINDSGWVVGHFLDTAVSAWADRAFLWKGSTVTKLPPLVTTGRSYAKKVNNRGIIVGFSTPYGDFQDDYWYGCAWYNGQIYSLPPASGYYQSFAFDINDSNTIVGISTLERDSWEGILTTWKVTIVNGTDLQISAPVAAPPDYKFEIWYELAGSPVAINNMDIVVGVGTDTLDNIQKLFMYQDGSYGDLSDYVDLVSSLYCTNSTIDINDSGQIVGAMAVGSPPVAHGFLLTGKYLGVNMPSESALMVAGETNIISWVNLGVTTVNIYYQVGESPVQYLIADHYPADSHYFVWDVPDTLLSAKVKIRIEDVSSSTYAESQTFRIKGYVLTRLNDDGDYEAFRPEQDGWQMLNDGAVMWPISWYNQFDYIHGNDPNTGSPYPQSHEHHFYDSNREYFIDWPLFTETFGLHQCYIIGADMVLRHRRSATDFWWRHAGSEFHGSCFGFALSSLLAFDRKSQFLASFGLPNFTDLYDVPVSVGNRKVINRLFETQYEKAVKDFALANARKSVNEVFAEVKSMLSSETDDHRAISIMERGPDGGGHTVVPYRVMKDPGNPAVFRVYTYDSNLPGDTGVFIEIDTTVHRWTYATLGWEEDSAGTLFLELPSSHSLEQPQFKSTEKTGYPMAVKADGGSDYMQILNSDARDIGIYAVNAPYGQGGFVKYDTTNGISIQGPSVFWPIIPATGGPHRPIGFYVPRPQDYYYSIGLSQLVDSNMYISLRTDSIIWNYSRHHADSTQVDNLGYLETATEKGFVAYYGNEGTRTIDITAILPGEDTEKALDVTILSLDPGNSIQTSYRQDGDFTIENKNIGFPTYSNLRLSQISTTGLSQFRYDSLFLDGETLYIIKRPNWDSLDTAPLKILIDHYFYGYGTIDDSVTLNNQPVDVDESGDLGLPRTFQLSQNYPNPFNPATTIEYALPRRSDVVIEIFDILGRKIRQLVNEPKSAGIYRVTWNGTDQSGNAVSTGVYLYRIQAGDHVDTKKMLLLK